MSARVAVLGAGRFGRGLALASARAGREVLLWSRTGRTLDHPRVACTRALADVVESELVFVVVPSVHVPLLAAELEAHLDGRHLLVHVSRGLAGPELRTLSSILREATPCRRVGALAGPLVAGALAEGAPSGAVVGTPFREVAEAVRDALQGPALRVYDNDDLVGVELASAMVGLLSVALGFAFGRGIGPGSLAVLVTRGMAEAARVGTSLGADAVTFRGLAGFGDLVSVVAGDDRPEARLGRALAEGRDLAEAARESEAHVEALVIARLVANHAERHRIDTPIIASLASVLEGRQSAEEAIANLMARRVGRE